MIIDIKYHIASIVAVFLALGIGILVGSAVIGNDVNDAIVQQHNKIYEQLKHDLDKMKSDNKAAKDLIAGYKSSLDIEREFEKTVLPMLVSGKLKEKNIAVIETNNSDLHGKWVESLRTAGAKITSITTILDGFILQSESTRKSLATKLMINESSDKEVTREIAIEVAAGIKWSQNMENLNYFEEQGMIKLSGDYGVPVDFVIIAGGSGTKRRDCCENLDIPMINYFLNNGIPVTGVEKSDIRFSYMRQYQKLKINTIDNIDMVPGQLSLVAVLSGQIGNYGIKSSAHRLLPVIP